MNIDAFTDSHTFRSRPEYLEHCVEQTSIDGLVLEFGVFEGRSVNVIAASLPDVTVYGFDSFDGLPERWDRGGSSVYEKGHFALDNLPTVRENVKLVKGFFDDTLPSWLSTHTGDIRLLHVDSDLYSSASFILTMLNDRIVPGTVIMFDELCDWSGKNVYPNWEQGEWLALCEWVQKFNRKFSIIGRTTLYQSAIIVE